MHIAITSESSSNRPTKLYLNTLEQDTDDTPSAPAFTDVKERYTFYFGYQYQGPSFNGLIY